MTQKKREIGLYVTCSEVALAVRVNDVPMAQTTGRPLNFSTILNPWIKTGMNEIAAQIERIDPQVPLIAPSVSISVRPVDAPRQGSDLFRYEWPNREQKADDLPARILPEAGEFQIPDTGFGPFLFAQNASEELTAGLENELAVALEPIYRAFIIKDVDSLMKLGGQRDSEYAACWGMEVGSYRERVRKDWTDLFGTPGFAGVEIVPLDRSNLKFLPCWKNMVFRVVRLDGKPVLSTQRFPAGFTTSYDVYLTRDRDNRWVWIR